MRYTKNYSSQKQIQFRIMTSKSLEILAIISMCRIVSFLKSNIIFILM